MKIFQGEQADQIEARVEQLEVALGLRHAKRPIEDRLGLIVSETISRVRGLENTKRELAIWKRPATEMARAIRKILEISR